VASASIATVSVPIPLSIGSIKRQRRDAVIDYFYEMFFHFAAPTRFSNQRWLPANWVVL
jgi:hypothetical protein